MSGRIVHGSDATVSTPYRVEADVVIIGSGAGGANVALRLMELGVERVLLLEAGGHYTREDFSPEEAVAFPMLYRESGLQSAMGDTNFPVMAAEALGGSTVVNAGICFRGPAPVTDRWIERHGIEWATQDELAPLYDWVWSYMGVMPTAEPFWGEHNKVSGRAFDSMGWRWNAIPRNTPGCTGCGVCNYGCPTGAKRSVDKAQIPAAVDLGLDVLTRARVTEIVTKGGKATGVEGVLLSEDGLRQRGPFSVRAKAVVLCAGGIGSPLVLQDSGLGGPDEGIGRGMHVHPASSTIGFFQERIEIWNGATQGVYADEFIEEGILFESSNVPAAAFYGLGAQLQEDPFEWMRHYPHVALVGAMIHDDGAATVTKDMLGKAKIQYQFDPRDIERFKRAAKLMGEAYFRAGAHLVGPGVRGVASVDSVARLHAVMDKVTHARQLVTMYASHPQSSVRMDADPELGPVAPNFAMHDVPNLFVADASVFPEALGVNPQITIMAFARKAAEFVAEAV